MNEKEQIAQLKAQVAESNQRYIWLKEQQLFNKMVELQREANSLSVQLNTLRLDAPNVQEDKK